MLQFILLHSYTIPWVTTTHYCKSIWSQSYSWILWCYTWFSLFFINTSAWWWPCKAETWSTIWYKKLPKLSCGWWFFNFPITSRNCLNRKYKCWWLVHILLKDGYKISKQGLETICHVCKWKYLPCMTCQYMPSYKREYYVCVTIPELQPELLTAWRHCMKPSMKRLSGVPLAVWQCKSYITFQSKKLVDFQMKSFANIHKIPVFILFSSPKKHLGWNQVTTDPAVQHATVVTHTHTHTQNIELYQMTLKGCFLGHRTTEMKKRKKQIK